MEFIQFTATPTKQSLKDGVVSVTLEISADKVKLDDLRGAMDRMCGIEISVPDPGVQLELDELLERETVHA